MREIKICMNEDRYKIKQITNNIFGLCIVPWTRNVFRTTVLHFPGMEKGKLNFAHKRNVCSKNTLWDEALERDISRTEWSGQRGKAKEWRRNRKKGKKETKKGKKRKRADVPFFSIPFLLFFLPPSSPFSSTLVLDPFFSLSIEAETFTDRKNWKKIPSQISMVAGGIKYYSFKGKMSGNVGFHRAGTIMAALSSSTDAHYGGRWTAIAVHGRPLCCAYRGCNRITSAADEVTGTCYGCIINDTGYSTVFHYITKSW